MAGQDLCQVALRKRQVGLQQVLGQGAHQRDPAPVHSGADDQAVDGVVLGLATVHGAKGVGEQLGGQGVVGGRADSAVQFAGEVLHPDGLLVQAQFVRGVVVHPQAEVLERGQHVGQGNWLAAHIQPQVRLATVARQQLRQLRGVVVGQQGLQTPDVLDGVNGGHTVGVAGREGIAIARQLAARLVG